MARREDNNRRDREEDNEFVDRLVHINRVAKTVKGGRNMSWTMIRVPLREGRTLHHDLRGRHGAGKVILRAAPPGTGVIAGGPMRAVLECLGVQDVVGKSLGTSNPYNMVRATFDGLKRMESPRMIASKRGKKVGDIVGRRNDGAGSPEALEA